MDQEVAYEKSKLILDPIVSNYINKKLKKVSKMRKRQLSLGGNECSQSQDFGKSNFKDAVNEYQNPYGLALEKGLKHVNIKKSKKGRSA